MASTEENVAPTEIKSERPKRATTKKAESKPKSTKGQKKKNSEEVQMTEDAQNMAAEVVNQISKDEPKENKPDDDDMTAVDDEVEADENAKLKAKKKTATKKSASQKAQKDAPSATTQQTEAPLSGDLVARCFNNLVSAADVKIESEKLRNICATNPDQTLASFQVCVNRVLAQYKASTQISLCCELIQQFVSSQNAVYQAKFLFKLVDNLRAKDKAVRLRSVHLIRLWLKVQSEVAEEIHARLVDGLLEAAYDKNPLVRQEIIACLEFLQDPNNAEDKVITLICLAAQHDPVAKVRRTALRVVSPTERSIEAFVGRTRDESDEVRLTCWKEMEERFKLQWFNAEQLMELFDQGLEDFSANCKAQCVRTLMKWFTQEKRSDICSLLECFDVEADEDVIIRMLDVVSLKYPKEKLSELSPATSLSKSASIWLRYCCQQKYEELDITATSLMESFTQIIQVMRHSKKDSPENYYSCSFIAKQLVLATSALELVHDPFGKSNVIRVLSEALLVEDFPADLVDPMTRALRHCFVEDAQFIVEITTNVLSFLSELSPLDQVRADILKAEQLIDDYTRAKNYASLPTLVAEIETLKEKERALVLEQQSSNGQGEIPTFSRLVRSTALVCALLRVIPRNSKDSLLGGLLDTTCVPAIQSPEVEARMYGVEALGLLALRDFSVAKSHGILLARTFFENEREDMQVRLRALQVLFDLLTAFGKEVCLPDETPNSSEGEVVSTSSKDFDLLIQYLMGLLEVDRDAEIRFMAANGLTKLLFLGRVSYPGLVQCLLIVLFHPSTDLNAKLKQCLLTFFAEYKQSKVVLQAAEPLIEAMIQPSEDSMCEDLPFEKVLERMCFLLRDQTELQLDFAQILLEKVAKHRHDSVANAKLMVKVLTSTNFGNVDEAIEMKLRKLRFSVDLVIRSRLLEADKVASKQLDKFASMLAKMDSTVTVEELLPEDTRKQVEQLFANTAAGEPLAARPKRAVKQQQGTKETTGDSDDNNDEDAFDSANDDEEEA